MPNTPGRPTSFLLGLLALLAPFARPAPGAASPGAAGAHPEGEQPRYFMSWGSPFGMPGSRDVLVPACGDSAGIDTLWLSFEVSRVESTFVAIAGEITLNPQTSDSLPDFWHMGRGPAARGSVVAEMGIMEEGTGESPWAVAGIGGSDFSLSPVGAYFRFVYAVPEGRGVMLKPGRRYTAGRILIRSGRPTPAGCEQPVSLNWNAAEFAFDRRSVRVHTGGAHVVVRGTGRPSFRLRPPSWRPTPPPPAEPRTPATTDPPGD